MICVLSAAHNKAGMNNENENVVAILVMDICLAVVDLLGGGQYDHKLTRAARALVYIQ